MLMINLLKGPRKNIRLGFLAVERIDLTTSEHVCQYKVLQNLDPLGRTRFIVIAE